MAIPCEPAQSHSEPSHHNPCRRISGNEGFEGKWRTHLIKLRKGLPTGPPLAQPKPSPPQPYPIPLRAAARHGLSLPPAAGSCPKSHSSSLGKGPQLRVKDHRGALGPIITPPSTGVQTRGCRESTEEPGLLKMG